MKHALCRSEERYLDNVLQRSEFLPLTLQSGWLPLCLCQTLTILLISCSIIRNWEHPFISAHTSTHPILQVYPQSFGLEFRRHCLDLDKWERKVQGEQDKRDDSSLPVPSQR